MAGKKGMIRFMIGLQLFFLVFGCASPTNRSTIHTGKGVYHQVEKGETLWGIGRKYRVNAAVLAQVNELQDPSRIYVGQRLWIPATNGVSTRSVSRTSPAKFRTSMKGLDFIWPVKGQILDRFRIEENHKNGGIDIAAPEGSDVLASLPGQVIFSGKGPGTYGNTIMIDHLNEYITVYTYNLENLVVKGQQVDRGEKIARVGWGKAATPMLHFEIRKDSVSCDPLNFLPPSEENSYDD